MFGRCFPKTLDEVSPTWSRNSPESHTSEKECVFFIFIRLTRMVVLYTSLRLVEGVYTNHNTTSLYSGWASVTEPCLQACMSLNWRTCWDKSSPKPSYSKKKQYTRLNSEKNIINNSQVMQCMHFWITYKTCNNTPDLREAKNKINKKSLTFRRKLRWRQLVNETRIVVTNKKRRIIELESWNKNGEDGNG